MRSAPPLVSHPTVRLLYPYRGEALHPSVIRTATGESPHASSTPTGARPSTPVRSAPPLVSHPTVRLLYPYRGEALHPSEIRTATGESPHASSTPTGVRPSTPVRSAPPLVSHPTVCLLYPYWGEALNPSEIRTATGESPCSSLLTVCFRR